MLGIIAQFVINESKTIEAKIEEQILKKDNTFKELVHFDIRNDKIYSFYKNRIYDNLDGLGMGIIEEDRKMITHILGGIPIYSNTGFTYGTGESKEINEFIIYGTITNPEITKIEVNGSDCDIIRAKDFDLWYYFADDSSSRISILAKDKNGKVILEEVL
ncbi:hypothetical protein JCM10914A_10670 [Paenibacillus sp. JCM 10914]